MSGRWPTRWKGLSPILHRRRWPASRPATSRWRISRWTVFLLNGTASSTTAADEIGGVRPMKIAMVSEHASPLAMLGGVDAGGQNVHVAELSAGLARRGHRVTVYTRRDDPDLPERVE